MDHPRLDGDASEPPVLEIEQGEKRIVVLERP